MASNPSFSRDDGRSLSLLEEEGGLSGSTEGEFWNRECAQLVCKLWGLGLGRPHTVGIQRMSTERSLQDKTDMLARHWEREAGGLSSITAV